jgi:hypothetical protein
VKLDFCNVAVEQLKVPPRYQLLLGVGATIRLFDDEGRIVFEEPDVPVVELALALEDWLTSGLDSQEDFEFDSLESDEPGLVWIRLQAPDTWAVGALEQEFPDPHLYSTDAVAEAFHCFVRSVEDWVQQNLGGSISDARTG